jgi:hypothetical protein
MYFLKLEVCAVEEHDDLVRAQTARRAFELYEAQHMRHGNDLDHWFTAEQEVRSRICPEIITSEGNLVLRLPLGQVHPNDLVVSISPKSIVLLKLLHAEAGGAFDRDLITIVPLPAPILPSSVEAELADSHIVIRAVLSQEPAAIAASA